MALKPVTVSQLNEYISRVLMTDPLLENVTVTGEISNLIVWVDSETNTLFYISGYLDKDQLVELAESVVPVEK